MTLVPLKLACGNLRPDRVGVAAECLTGREQTRGRVARHTVLAQLARLARRRRPGGVNVTVIDGM